MINLDFLSFYHTNLKIKIPIRSPQPQDSVSSKPGNYMLRAELPFAINVSLSLSQLTEECDYYLCFYGNANRMRVTQLVRLHSNEDS